MQCPSTDVFIIRCKHNNDVLVHTRAHSLYMQLRLGTRSNNINNIARTARMPVERYASEYNMRHGRRGMAIIFNHEHFEVMSLKARAGTNVDCENLRNTLDRLHFDVVVYKDYRFSEIQHQIETSKYYFAPLLSNMYICSCVWKCARVIV